MGARKQTETLGRDPVLASGDGSHPAKSPPPLIDRLRRIAARIPQRELDNLPLDLIENLDHYIYGTPKR